ncbi:asparaginase, partial [Escherichia coli]|nr:asparaginase [Escherichia coli]
VESGAADAAGLTDRHLAIACGSHIAAPVHTRLVASWLADLGLGDDDLLCGAENPRDRATKFQMIRAGGQACQVHNNCSGKHAGFLTVARHLGAGPDYVQPDHPVQLTVRAAFEEVTGARSPGYGIDGCAAPNFATTLHGLGRAMGYFAGARGGSGDLREQAAARLRDAMGAHPDLVAG